MAKPRVFVSSTYYDLRHIRKGIEMFINEMGYDPVLFESGDIPFAHDVPLDESCYKEIGSSHILVLIIGGRFGSQTSEPDEEVMEKEIAKHYKHYNSITQKELETAIAADIPVYIFVENGVSAEYQTYKENRDSESINYAHVDSVNIFRLLDSIYALKRNNLIKDFSNLDEITNWLRDQWAGLFAEFLTVRPSEKPIKSLQHQLSNLENVTAALKSYSETIIRGVSPEKAEDIIAQAQGELDTELLRTTFEQTDIVDSLIQEGNLKIDKIIEIFTKPFEFRGFLDLFSSDLDFSLRECAAVFSYHKDEINILRNLVNRPAFSPENWEEFE